MGLLQSKSASSIVARPIEAGPAATGRVSRTNAAGTCYRRFGSHADNLTEIAKTLRPAMQTR